MALLAILLGLAISSNGEPRVGDIFPSWKNGYLDIHHISTNRGDSAFLILPDGTTMLIDAGDRRVQPAARPDASRTPGEWISRYIRQMMKHEEEPRLNYILITHFHRDHMGGLYSGQKVSENGGYQLAGVTEVGDNLPFDVIVDRGWPDYDWPVPLRSEMVANYRKFVDWHRENRGAAAERFRAGANDQFVLVNDPGEFPNFEIRNVAVNGHVWTGVHNNTRNHFPPLESIDGEDYPSENACSTVIRLSYGNFDYYTGGDLIGIPHAGNPSWHDLETPVAKAIGPVDVLVLNHHGVFDAQNEFFLKTLRPRVYIAHTAGRTHLSLDTFRRLTAPRLRPESSDIFATYVPQITREYIGSRINEAKSLEGHIVVRVHPGGGEYSIYILDDSTESYRITGVHGPYESR